MGFEVAGAREARTSQELELHGVEKQRGHGGAALKFQRRPNLLENLDDGFRTFPIFVFDESPAPFSRMDDPALVIYLDQANPRCFPQPFRESWQKTEVCSS